MSKAKHTCGPWRCQFITDRHAIIETTAHLKPGDPGFPMPIKPSAANARLIESAPELLAACEMTLADLDAYMREQKAWDENRRQLRAAIAQAKGGAA